MNVFSIRDIENLTGIKAHTLRIWEQRYDLICPKRRESKHRFYDNEDLKYLLRIAYLYNRGYKISRIACLAEDEIRKLALEPRPDAENHEIYVNQLIEASIDFDTSRFEKVLHNLVLHAGFEKSITCVVFPMLRKLGLLWLTGNVIPAQEHFASALIIKKIAVATDGLERPVYSGGRRVLLFTPAGEYHEMPILFMQYLLKKHGVPFLYAGRNITIDMLVEICEHQQVSQLYFHLITNLIRCDLNEYLKKLEKLFPGKEIIMSGTCNCHTGSTPNIRILRSAEEQLAFSRK